MYVGFNGMEQEKVYFFKSEGEGKNRKTVSKDVPWRDRFDFNEEGFRMVGVNLGVSKITDSSGKEVNDKKVMTQYDACQEVYENLKDDASVFIRGNIAYSEYQGKHQTRFEPTQISLCRPVDFEQADFQPTADFTQSIVFMGIKPNEDKTKFTVSAKIVTYKTIEDAEFYITDTTLANVFKKNMKPYQSIKVWGNISVEQQTEEVEIESVDCWGEANEMEKVSAPTIRELIITGADPTTIDKEAYSEAVLDEAIEIMKENKQASSDYGDDGEKWGSNANLDDDDDSAW